MYVGNTFNTNDKPAGFVVTSANNTINNCTINTTTSGGISIPIQNLAVNTTINNTKVYAAGSAISSGTNGTLTNCDVYLGAGITATAGSYLKNNTIHGTGAMTVAANSTVINSTLNTVTISGLNVTFENNTVKNKLTVSSRNNIKNNNLTEVQVNTAASSSNITFNNITGTVLSQAANVTIDNNNITTANDYTVTVTGANNKVTNNYLVTNVKAVKKV